MIPDKDLTDDVLDEIIAGAKTSMEQYLALSLKAERAAGNSPAQGGSRCSIKAAPALDSSPKTAESRCGNSPVIPDGYVMVPKEPTAEMVIKMRYHVGGYDRNIKEGYKAMLAAADCSIPMISDTWIPVC